MKTLVRVVWCRRRAAMATLRGCRGYCCADACGGGLELRAPGTGLGWSAHGQENGTGSRRWTARKLAAAVAAAVSGLGGRGLASCRWPGPSLEPLLDAIEGSVRKKEKIQGGVFLREIGHLLSGRTNESGFG